ncbi:RICIN domain-containing protein [Dactylosporangium sp. NPDC050588]|uniref:RICIN domain-containing protein n=1 Tax=Dactylosporangium sp. NPDC050588 TaxID=3157211 RepID=UPI00340BF396
MQFLTGQVQRGPGVVAPDQPVAGSVVEEPGDLRTLGDLSAWPGRRDEWALLADRNRRTATADLAGDPPCRTPTTRRPTPGDHSTVADAVRRRAIGAGGLAVVPALVGLRHRRLRSAGAGRRRRRHRVAGPGRPGAVRRGGHRPGRRARAALSRRPRRDRVRRPRDRRRRHNRHAHGSRRQARRADDGRPDLREGPGEPGARRRGRAVDDRRPAERRRHPLAAAGAARDGWPALHRAHRGDVPEPVRLRRAPRRPDGAQGNPARRRPVRHQGRPAPRRPVRAAGRGPDRAAGPTEGAKPADVPEPPGAAVAAARCAPGRADGPAACARRLGRRRPVLRHGAGVASRLRQDVHRPAQGRRGTGRGGRRHGPVHAAGQCQRLVQPGGLRRHRERRQPDPRHRPDKGHGRPGDRGDDRLSGAQRTAGWVVREPADAGPGRWQRHSELWDCNGGGAQNWVQEGNRLRNPNSNKCLDSPGGSTADGARLQIWDCNGSAAQYFVKAA